MSMFSRDWRPRHEYDPHESHSDTLALFPLWYIDVRNAALNYASIKVQLPATPDDPSIPLEFKLFQTTIDFCDQFLRGTQINVAQLERVGEIARVDTLLIEDVAAEITAKDRTSLNVCKYPNGLLRMVWRNVNPITGDVTAHPTTRLELVRKIEQAEHSLGHISFSRPIRVPNNRNSLLQTAKVG